MSGWTGLLIGVLCLSNVGVYIMLRQARRHYNEVCQQFDRLVSLERVHHKRFEDAAV